MKKVLIVDDIDENRYLLEVLVKGYGFESISASNGAEALSLAIREMPDIVISDILMPVMDGYSFCNEWKKNETLRNIPFVFYTATYTHPKDEEFALSLGADRFLIKPQEPDFFINMINEVINDFKANKIEVRKPSNLDELNTLKEYNEALIRKMEDRMLKSEEAEKKISDYARQLEIEIEERKQTTVALKESEKKYRSIYENSAIAILLTSPKEGKVISANDYACKMFGRSHDEICSIGRNGLVDLF